MQQAEEEADEGTREATGCGEGAILPARGARPGAEGDWGGSEEWDVRSAVLSRAEVEEESVLPVAVDVEGGAVFRYIRGARCARLSRSIKP